MEDTTRTLAILAVAVLVLAPLVNGVLEDAAATADRVFLKDADWDGDPPENPPDQQPRDLNRSEIPPGNRTIEANRSARSCTPETTRTVQWIHEDIESSPGPALSNRSTDPSQQTFEVNETHVGLGVRFVAENVTGQLSASVYPEGGEAQWSVSKSNPLQDDMSSSSTITRPQLTSGTWVAELDNAGSSYSRLAFVVALAHCSEAAG